MKKTLCAAVAAIGVCGGCEGMERDSVNWQEVIAKTQVISVENPVCQSAIRAIEGDSSANWSDIEQYALDGDPVSQYCMALRCDSLARIRYNGERKKLRSVEAMFLLLSSEKGKYRKAIEATEALKASLSLKSEINFSDFKNVSLIAEELALKIDK